MNRISSARLQAAARQHGAMDHSTPPCDWAADMDSVIREHGGGNRRIAIDRIAPQGVIEMQRHG